MLRTRGASACAAALVTGVALLSGTVAAVPAAAALPPAPVALSPIEQDATRQLKNIELRWEPVAGASGYEVQISDTGLFGAGTYSASTIAERFAAPVALPAGDLAWRVRAVTAGGRTAWSAPEHFTRGWIAAPARPVTHPGGVLPAFSWDPLTDASFYEVEFSKVPPGAMPGATYEATKEHYTCFTSHTYLAPYGVVTGKALENPPGSETSCAFDVTAAEEGAEPYALNGGFELGETYYWRVRGRDGTVDTRTTPLQVAEGSCTGQWVESGVTGTGSGAKLPIGGEAPKYDVSPECSEWADGGEFTVAYPQGDLGMTPAVPADLELWPSADPTAASVVATDTPLFRWAPVPGAVKYRVHISSTPDMRNNVRVWETYGNSLMPLGSIRDSTGPSYWNVQACNFALECSTASAVHDYLKVSETYTKPVITKGDRGPTILTWSVQEPAAPQDGEPVPAALQAKAYEVQVARAGEFARAAKAEEEPVLVHSSTVDRIADPDDTSTSSLVLDRKALPQGEYEWRVRPADQTGQPDLRWSATSDPFRVDWTAPTITIATRAGFTGSTLRITTSEKVTGLDDASVDVVEQSTGKAVEGSLTGAGTAWTFTAARPFVAGERYLLHVDGDAVADLSENTAIVTGAPVQASKTLDSASPALAQTKGDSVWSTVTASDAVGRSFLRSSDTPSTTAVSSVKGTVRGTRVWVYGCVGPKGGMVEVLVDGNVVQRANLWRSYSGCLRIYASPTALTDKQHTVEVRATGVKDTRSSGYGIEVDAISVP